MEGEHVTNEVETRFTGDDSHVQGALHRMLAVGERVNRVFDHASDVLGEFASVASVVGGAFTLGKALETTNEYMRSIDRISTLTKLTTQRTDGLLEAMDSFGIEGETAERVLLGISRTTANMETHMNAFGQTTGTAASMLRGMGVDLKKGPIESLEGMSRAVQKGKLGVAELGMAFGVPRNQTIALYKMLQKGPEYIRENIKEAERFGVTFEDMQAFKRMKAAQNDIGTAWKRINLIIGAQLMPFVAELLEGGAKRLKGWVEQAREFGSTMRDFLSEHYRLLVRIGQVMLANYTIERATGKGLSENLTDHGSKLLQFLFPGGGAGRFLGPGKKVESGIRSGEIITTASGGAMAARQVALMNRDSTSGIWTSVSALATRLKPLVAGLGRATAIGLTIAYVVKAFYMIKDNTLQIRDYIVYAWNRTVDAVTAIGESLAPLFGAVSAGGALAKIGQFFEESIAGVIMGLGEMVAGVMKMTLFVIKMTETFTDRSSGMQRAVGEFGHFAVAEQLTEMALAKAAGERRRAEDLRLMDSRFKMQRAVPSERDRQPYFDFRGSRFDIKQAFADVDPDRIAVAFADSLGTMGERRVQSSFAPLWGV